jgi:hypothetical protein
MHRRWSSLGCGPVTPPTGAHSQGAGEGGGPLARKKPPRGLSRPKPGDGAFFWKTTGIITTNNPPSGGGW